MRLKDRPWKLVAAALLATMLVIIGGVDLIDGSVHLRHHVVSMSGDPVRFAFYVLGWFGTIAVSWFAWLALIDEWNRDYAPRWRPRFDDPTHRRSARP